MRIIGIFCLAAACSGADLRDAMETSISRQRQSVAAMWKSVEAQQRSAVKETAADAVRPEAADGTSCDPVPPDLAATLTGEAARREGIDPELLRAVARRESGFRPCAISAKGAKGLMQLMPATVEQFGVRDPFDPKQSVDAGARLLKQLLDRYGGDVSLALGAYNAGPATVDAAGGVPGIRETLAYVGSILGTLAGR